MHKYIIKHLLIGFFLLSLISCGVSKIKEPATPVTVPVSPKPGDCAACHQDKKVLPKDHVNTKDMTGNACGACHKGKTSLWTKIPLGHIHRLKGVSCKGCHEDPAAPKPIDSKVCETCHDTKSLIDSSNGLEVNPHFSPHDGKVPDCNKCHHQHKSSENYCAQCHDLKYKVP